MKTQFYKGQKVFDPRHGWGEVADTQHHKEYPICVDFGTFTLSYTNDGRMYDVHKYPILSAHEYHRPEHQLKPDSMKHNNEKTDAIPYQKCPKCDGQGIVSKPPYVPGDVYGWSSTATSFTCNVCHGQGIIPMYILNNEQ